VLNLGNSGPPFGQALVPWIGVLLVGVLDDMSAITKVLNVSFM